MRQSPKVIDPRTLTILLLITLTLAVFWPVAQCSFINFDDDGYITANPIVQQGLTLHGIRYAFTQAPLELWHPLSFISFMIDYELFGLNPAGYHIENLLFHTANVVLLFLILNRMTGSTWRSALAAALFAVHPLRVESVAWIAERKDVLAMFFGLLTILAYIRHIRSPRLGNQLLMLTLFSLSLLAKPMFIPLPLLLLLLDYWPLKRSKDRPAWSLLREKLPMLAVAGLFFLVVQSFSKPPAVHSDAYLQSPSQRLATMTIACVQYLIKMVDFRDLAVLYPIPPSWPTWWVWGSITLLAIITSLAIWRIRANPWLAVGWFWYIVALLPVSGAVRQVGFHSMADRYTYLPGIGLLMALIWSLPERMVQSSRGQRWTLWGSAAIVLSLCFATHVQIGYWRDSVTLFEHALSVTENNDFAHYSLGNAYFAERQDLDRAIQHYRAALQIRPDLTSAHDNLGLALMRLGGADNVQSAREHFQRAIEVDPACATAMNNLGTALAALGDHLGAVEQFRRSLALKPVYLEARLNLAYTLLKLQRWDEATQQFNEVLRFYPGDPNALAGLSHAQAKSVR